MNAEPVIVEATLHAPVEKVWKALTDRNEMQNWYFDLAEFKAEKGFAFEFASPDNEGKTFLHKCVVTEVIPLKKLTYSWRYEGYAGNSYVTFELDAQADYTCITVTHTALETFPQDEPAFAKQNFQMGWTQIIRTSLKNYVEG